MSRRSSTSSITSITQRMGVMASMFGFGNSLLLLMSLCLRISLTNHSLHHTYLINRITHSTSCQSQNPKTPSEYRPISVLPVISRLVERYVGHRLIYPAFLTPPMDNLIKNQFAFRPTGSTTAAIIFIVHNINELL